MANFEEALKKTLINEGGYSNDKDDHGGETKYGISKKSYPEVDIKCLTLDKAKKIYRNNYWDVIRGDEINSQSLAFKLFDLAVNLGCRRAVRFIQQALADLFFGFDGDIGKMDDETLETINNSRDTILIEKLKEIAKSYYLSLNNKKYIKGWLNRLERG